MKRIRLGTALLVVAIAALVLALVTQQRRVATLDRSARAAQIQHRRAIRSYQFQIDRLQFEVRQLRGGRGGDTPRGPIGPPPKAANPS